ncbi:cytochrome P450 1A1-like [Haliotis rufescens]|uniref:cytochrome P450 1A1-like n=1 Tax=Haliotis rufescens TaxID=6454 RepID=UPI00201F7C37|nr:cytochrome P450 1A1-like [Haliotis rufescens]
MSTVALLQMYWGGMCMYFRDITTLGKAGVVFLASASLLTFLHKLTYRNKSIPGPWGLPLIGHLPFLGKKPFLTFMNMRKIYGDLIKLQFGAWPTVVIHGKLIKEALSTKGDAFSGRPQFFSSVSVQNGKSLSFGKFDISWKLHRRIANKSFQAFANARSNPIEEIINEEVSYILEEFERYNGRAFDPHDHIYIALGSVIYQICYGRKGNVRADKDFCEYILHTQDFSTFVTAGNPVDIFPWLRHFMKERINKFKDLLSKGHLIRRERIRDHLETFSSDNLRDVADSLINESRQLTEEDKANGMSEERVQDTIGDLFAAGFDTVATTTMWTMLLLAKTPRVQKKIQEELDAVVGMSRRPTLADRRNLVYTEATIHEILRIINLTPLSTPHATTEDVELAGYTIKKDTLVFLNLFSLSHDEEVWGDPEAFRPERFLKEDGQIDSRLVDNYLPFSAGRRRCMGEFLARIELFLIISGFLQRCTFVKPKDVDEYTMDCTFGLNQKPLPYKVEVQFRM